jgi:hypothetical protein
MWQGNKTGYHVTHEMVGFAHEVARYTKIHFGYNVLMSRKYIW